MNYISEPIKKSVGLVQDQMMSLFKTEDYIGPEPVKTVYGSIRNLFQLKKEKKNKLKIK